MAEDSGPLISPTKEYPQLCSMFLTLQVRLRLLSLALLSSSAASALPQRSDWHAHYAGDSAPYGAPVDEPSSGEEWSGGGGGSAPGREWHSAYPPDPVVAEAQRRQYYEEVGFETLDAVVVVAIVAGAGIILKCLRCFREKKPLEMSLSSENVQGRLFCMHF